MGREKRREKDRGEADDRRRYKDEKRRRKEMKEIQKQLETPEEKRARRLAKKQAKHGKDGADSSLFGYTNDSNPFGDANLLTPFRWHKKSEQIAKKKGVKVSELEEDKVSKRRREIKDEVEKVKRRRAEREVERQEWEEERARLAREADGFDAAELHEKEEAFHLSQAKARSKIRIQQGRAKAIDIIAKNLEGSDEAEDLTSVGLLEVEEPWKVVGRLACHDLVDLREDILQRLDLGHSVEFWKALLTVCEDEIQSEQARLAAQRHQRGRVGATGLHRVIEDSVLQDLAKKSHSELLELKDEIFGKLEGGGVDAEYWEALAARVVVCAAKARLEELHSQLLQRRLSGLQQILKQQDDEKEREYERGERGQQQQQQQQQQVKEEPEEQQEEDGDVGAPLADEIETHYQLSEQDLVALGFDKGGWESPRVVSEIGEEAFLLEEDDVKLLSQQRRLVADQKARVNQGQTEGNTRGQELVAQEAERGMGEGDAAFNIEVPLPHDQQWWHDKYRPRKPRFFNRVHTGYEWNKYNQTHYDHDNPPPKTVQGYKFNIFYPDLLDPTKAPQYFIEPGDNPDTVRLRFQAGPPYEDIAFNIVNRKWEVSRRSGFKCTFDRGVLHLFFNFKRERYRR